MKPDTDLVSYREFARRDGCSERRVRNGVQSGALPTIAGCLLPSHLARTAWRAGNIERTANAEASAPKPAGSASQPNLTEARRVREIALANKRRHEYATRVCDWLPPDLITEICDGHVRTVRAILERLPTETAPLVVTCERIGEVQAVLHSAVYAALNEACAAPQMRSAPATTNPPHAPIPASASRLEAETAKVIAIGKSHQLDLDISHGLVVNLHDIVGVFGQRVATARTRLLAIEGELPPHLFGQNQATVERILTRAVNEALADLDAPYPQVLKVKGKTQ